VRPRSIAARTLRRLAAELITEIRHLDRRISVANTEITHAVQASRSTLTELRGIGHLNAGKILARVGDVHRFRSAAAFASYTGTAPIEVSSGDVVRHRLSRAGDRQLNCCLHTMAITQLQRDCPGRTYYLRKRADGKSHKEALRCLKRSPALSHWGSIAMRPVSEAGRGSRSRWGMAPLPRRGDGPFEYCHPRRAEALDRR
jgi:transposase